MDEIIRTVFNSGTIDIKGYKVQVENGIAEGGFGYVFKVRDIKTNRFYALKRLLASDKETKNDIQREIKLLTDIQPHPHIMKFIGWTKVKQNLQSAYLLLSEFCSQGCLTDLQMPMENHQQMYRIIYQTSLAINHMHNLGVIHRDIKAENILFDDDGFVKLCDFGSATTDSYEPNSDWTPHQRSTVEEDMQRHTTPMYRPPEILETYLHYSINGAIDIWALGCLAYYIRFGQHAFPDSGKLRIINCHYNIPKDSKDGIVNVIKQCLKPDPKDRISISSLIQSLELEFSDTILKSPVIPSKSSAYKIRVEDSITSTKSTRQSASTSSIKEKSTLDDLKSIIPEPPKEDVLIELIDTPTNILPVDTSKMLHDYAEAAGLTSSQSTKNVDFLTDLEIISPNDVISDQKVLSPEKATLSDIPLLIANGKKDVFEDLLPEFKKNTNNNNGQTNMSRGHLTNGSLLADLDFESNHTSKIMEWKEKRRGNIRALLSSLHLVLSSEFSWKPIGMQQLIADSDVKKVYRKACLAVHPDKVRGTDTQEMAKLIFMELNDAWSKFESNQS